MTRQLALAESGPAQLADLTEAEADALNASGLALAVRAAEPGRWLVGPDRKVGTLQVGSGLQISVTPKVSIDRLVFMMGYARDPSFWRDNPVELSQHEELPEALAHTFHRLASSALQRGLLHGYRTIDDSLHVIRGRIRADDQLRLRYAMPLPIEVRYDEYTADIAENQILLAATLCLLRAPQVARETRGGLQRLRLLLANVTPPPASALPPWRSSRLNSRYQASLHLAELILASSSFDQRQSADAIEVSGFLFEAWKIFEDFACVALAEALPDSLGRAEYQYRGRLDVGGHISIEPDFSWWRGTQPVAVVDAKYKGEKSSRFPNADSYQVLAYCTALGIDNGHLIYAKGEAEQRSYPIARSPITVHCHALDLAVRPQELLHLVGRLAQRIASGLPLPPLHSETAALHSPQVLREGRSGSSTDRVSPITSAQTTGIGSHLAAIEYRHPATSSVDER